MRKNKAFTLVEVLVAMVIFGILAGGIVVVFNMENIAAMRGLDMNAKLTTERYSIAGIQDLIRGKGALRSIDIVPEDEAKNFGAGAPGSLDDFPDDDPTPNMVAIYQDSDTNSKYYGLLMVREYDESAGGFESRPLFSAVEKLKYDEGGYGLEFALTSYNATALADAASKDYTLEVSVTADKGYMPVRTTAHDHLRGLDVAERAANRKIALSFNAQAIGASAPLGVTPVKDAVAGSGVTITTAAWSGPAIILTPLYTKADEADEPPVPPYEWDPNRKPNITFDKGKKPNYNDPNFKKSDYNKKTIKGGAVEAYFDRFDATDEYVDELTGETVTRNLIFEVTAEHFVTYTKPNSDKPDVSTLSKLVDSPANGQTIGLSSSDSRYREVRAVNRDENGNPEKDKDGNLIVVLDDYYGIAEEEVMFREKDSAGNTVWRDPNGVWMNPNAGRDSTGNVVWKDVYGNPVVLDPKNDEFDWDVIRDLKWMDASGVWRGYEAITIEGKDEDGKTIDIITGVKEIVIDEDHERYEKIKWIDAGTTPDGTPGKLWGDETGVWKDASGNVIPRLDADDPSYRRVVGTRINEFGRVEEYTVAEYNAVMVQARDPSTGELLTDFNGDPVLKPKTDANGRPVLDESSNPLAREYTKSRDVVLQTSEFDKPFYVENGTGGVKEFDFDDSHPDIYLVTKTIVKVYTWDEEKGERVLIGSAEFWNGNLVQFIPPPFDGGDAGSAGGGFYEELRDTYRQNGMDGLTSNSARATTDKTQLRDALVTIKVVGETGLVTTIHDLATDNIVTSLNRDNGQPSVQGMMGMMKKMEEKHFKDPVDYEKAYAGTAAFEGIAFTSAANYSMIVEFALDPTYTKLITATASATGNAIAFNSYISDANISKYVAGNNNIGQLRSPVDGFAVAYDHDHNALEDTKTSPYLNKKNLRVMKTDGATSSAPAATPQPQGTTGARFYKPSDMENSKFKFTDDNTWWRGRKRVMYTILEYVQGNDVRYIIRAKFLETIGEHDTAKQTANYNRLIAAGDKKDYFYIGREFFLSEPIWFGDFVGSPMPPEEPGMVLYNLNKVYPDGFAATAKPADFSSYGVVSPTNSVNTFGRRALTGTSNHKPYNRDRWWTWSILQTNPGQNLLLFSIKVAPGFTADELRAIMPEGSRMLKPKEVYKNSTFDYVHDGIYSGPTVDSKNPDYNAILFGTTGTSDGKGNRGNNYIYPAGVNQIQYPSYAPYYLKEKINAW